MAEPNNNEFEPKNASQERAMLEECLNMFLNLDSKVVKAEYNFRMVPLENTGHIEIEIDLRSGSELSSPHVNRVRCEHDKMLMMSMSHYIDRDGNEQICFLTYECSGKNVEPLYLRLLSKIKAAQG
ncbi:MAG: hypothetical protein NTZ80_02820 [Patescibacteria group bacterium]|nr:hypothetical protein [Patescibacteria group bacterium]